MSQDKKEQAAVIAELFTERIGEAAAALGLIMEEHDGTEYFLLKSATLVFNNKPRNLFIRLILCDDQVYEFTLDPDGDAEIIHKF